MRTCGFRGGRRRGFPGGRRCGFRRGGNARPFNQTHQRLRPAVPVGLGARRAVKTAPSARIVRDALTPECGLTRFFACIKARDFSRRSFFHVNLTGARVAFGAGNSFAPSRVRVRCGMSRGSTTRSSTARCGTAYVLLLL